MTLEEDDVGCAELEDEVWLEEATCCDCGVSITDQVPLLFLGAKKTRFLEITEVCDRADDFGGREEGRGEGEGFSMKPYLAS